MPRPGPPYIWKLWRASLKAAKKNRSNLARLEELFEKGAGGGEILTEFGLTRNQLAHLSRLALRPDGWYPAGAIIAEKDPKVAGMELLALAEGGLILARPFRKLVKLSDSGRYVLILSDFEPEA